MMTKRKKRSDRNHVIYCITNVVTGEQYVGLTAVVFNGNIKRTLIRRMQKHLQRAKAEDKNWGLCESLRTYGAENFEYGVLDIVRGKAQAHAAETNIINQYNPQLNTFKRGV